MSEPDADEPLSPQAEAQVRRLLADARATEPLPGDVAARLDAVLAGLQAERAAPPPPVRPAPLSPGPPRPPGPPGPPGTGNNVVDFAARRRRRGALVLVAAAAVMVVGVGAGLALRDSPEPDLNAGNAADSSREPNAAAEDGAVPSMPAQPAPSASSSPRGQRLPTVAPGSFRRDVVRLRAFAFLNVSGEELVPPQALNDDPRFVCEPHAWGPGQLLAILYDGAPAVLVYRPPRGDVQVAEVLQCGSAAVLRSTVIPSG